MMTGGDPQAAGGASARPATPRPNPGLRGGHLFDGCDGQPGPVTRLCALCFTEWWVTAHRHNGSGRNGNSSSPSAKISTPQTTSNCSSSSSRPATAT
jgi:hypothetical protein